MGRNKTGTVNALGANPMLREECLEALDYAIDEALIVGTLQQAADAINAEQPDDDDATVSEAEAPADDIDV